MCVMSMVMDHYGKQWDQWQTPWNYVPTKPYIPPYVPPYDEGPQEDHTPYPEPVKENATPYRGPTKEQFEELLDLMRKAKDIDKATGQPDCEMEEKKELIRKIAEKLGVPLKELEDIWGEK